jgi:AAA ATPase domain
VRPKAFQIKDFKSINDSGICHLSGDSITVLAGQNEAGKTAVLTALRDFDLGEGSAPNTADYQPDERLDAAPSVSVQFESDLNRIIAALLDEHFTVPRRVIQRLRADPTFWITRDLQAGKYSLDPTLAAMWESESSPEREPQPNAEAVTAEPAEPTSTEEPTPKRLGPGEFAVWLRDEWPTFVYFDSFQDSLPRQVDFADLQPAKKAAPAAGSPLAAAQAASEPTATRKGPIKAPASVQDFVTLADLDIARVSALSDNDKSLGNYLSSRGAVISGDFLTYWKQKVDKDEAVDIRVRHLRDSAGTLKLAFYVHDKSDQYPDQRSKGFLWFLSFYLKLAAVKKKYPERKRLLLIDEPGSYLHARAQRDVLHLFEDRIVPSDQVIYSTHSPYLIPPDRLHRLRIVLKTTASGTKVLDRLTHPDLRGVNFADSLSPVIAAIGIDISQSINFNKERNLFVEGISDLMYVTAWAGMFNPELIEKFNIFPGTGATTIPLLASLFIGWGFNFVALLDNDEQGQSVREKLARDLLFPPSRIVHPRDAKAIEDLLSAEDFRALLGSMDNSLTLNPGETPTAAIRRQSIDKVLLARTFSERAAKSSITLTKKSHDGISRLLADILAAWRA